MSRTVEALQGKNFAVANKKIATKYILKELSVQGLIFPGA